MASPITVHTTSTPLEVALKRFVEGPPILERTLADLQADEFDQQPADGAWTIRQIVHHIVDGDDIWKTGIKIALGSDQAEFTLAWYWTRTQREWADSWSYSRRSLAESLDLLKANRNHIAQLLSMTPDSWTRSVSVRDSKGTLELITVGFIVEMQTEHLLHHLNRILHLHKQGGGV